MSGTAGGDQGRGSGRGSVSPGWPSGADRPGVGGVRAHLASSGWRRAHPAPPQDAWIAALADAVAQGAVDARYRPVFDLPSGEVRGAEAVAVWPGIGRSLTAPDRLPLARSRGTDAIPAVGAALQQVAQRVVEGFAFGVPQTHGWWASIAFDEGLVSAPQPVQRLASVLERAGFPGDRLVVELSERALARGLANGTVGRLGSVGVRFAAADFGTGDISPADLRRVPLAFVRVALGGMSTEDAYDLGLLRSVVAAADALGITVLGHGIETDEQLDLANRAGIGLVQGYRWGSPGSLEKLSSTWARLP